MNQFKKAQIVMQTKENTGRGIYLNPVPSINKIHYWGKRISNSYIAQHLYIVSDDKIEKDDWVILSHYRKSGMIFKYVETNSVGSSKLYNPITKKEESYGYMFIYIRKL